MKILHFALSVSLLLALSACSYKNIPTATTNLSINLTKDDVEIIDKKVNGSGMAFTIFPFYFFSPAIYRAEAYAKSNALDSNNVSDADFLLESKSNSFYLNFIIFDYASSSITAKGIKFKK